MSDPIDRLRVLVVGIRPPRLPIRDGYVLHLYHLLAQMHRRHDVRFVAGDDGAGAFTDIDGLVSFLVPIAGGPYVAGILDQVSKFQPHVVHYVGAPLAWTIRRLPDQVASVLGALDAPHLNIDAVDAQGMAARLRKRLRRSRATWAIRHSYTAADRVVVVSDEDRHSVLEENPRLPISVIPNGVDLEAFASRNGLERQPDHLLFTGALDYAPNIAAATFLVMDVFPRIRVIRPSTRLSLVGRDPSPEVIGLAEQPGVDVIGPVDDMADALSSASVYICPMINGTGIKNKLLEAMANGLPCVATELAVRGTGLRDGVNVLIANKPGDLSDAALRLLSDSELRQRIGKASQRYVTRNHSWPSVEQKFSDLYLDVIRPATSGGS